MNNDQLDNENRIDLIENIKKLEKIAIMDKAVIECSKILLLNHEDVKASITMLLEYVCDFFDADYACIYERDYDRKITTVTYSYETGGDGFRLNDVQPFAYERHTAFSEELVKHEYLFLEDGDVLLETNFNEFSANLYCGNILAVPIKVEDVLVDVFCIHGLKKNFDLFEFILTTAVLITNNIQIDFFNKKLQSLVNYDALTGLCTEHRFREEVKKMLLEHPERKYAIITANVDNFKYINTSYGYEVGTKVLVIIGELLKQVASYPELVTRSYKDNFLLLVESDKIETLINEKESMFTALSSPVKAVTSKEFTLSYSLGYYHIVDVTQEIDRMIDCAIIAMRKGKDTTGYTLHGFTKEMQLEQMNNGDITATMYDAILKKEFVVYYQPKVSLVDGCIVGAEALVRWIRKGKVVPPNDFIPLFEKNGFIEKLDYYVLDAVCEFIEKHVQQRIPRISVNLSGVTLMNEGLEQHYREILASHNVKQEQIVIEVTESALAIQFSEAVERIESLKREGFIIAMDDFGTGVSSLNRLKDVNIDLLKMDRGFIVDSVGNKKGVAVIKNMLHMASELKLESIGEGIETEDELNLMKDLGCDIGQGYYFSKPMPPNEFLFKLQEV